MAPAPPHLTVYLGPTLPIAEARTILDADYRPPVKRGDIKSLLSTPPVAIGIVDGEFFQNFAISPKEILRALESGITVFGASSMGALRAAELYSFGMVGVGQVFRLYKSGRIDADDEVAVVYAEEDGRSLSDPMFNIRFALKAAVEEGIITPQERRILIRRMKRTYFPQRSYARLLEVSRSVLRPDRVGDLRRFLREGAPDVKRDDAILLLREMRRFASGGS